MVIIPKAPKKNEKVGGQGGRKGATASRLGTGQVREKEFHWSGVSVGLTKKKKGTEINEG